MAELLWAADLARDFWYANHIIRRKGISTRRAHKRAPLDAAESRDLGRGETFGGRAWAAQQESLAQGQPPDQHNSILPSWRDGEARQVRQSRPHGARAPEAYTTVRRGAQREYGREWRACGGRSRRIHDCPGRGRFAASLRRFRWSLGGEPTTTRTRDRLDRPAREPASPRRTRRASSRGARARPADRRTAADRSPG